MENIALLDALKSENEQLRDQLATFYRTCTCEANPEIKISFDS